MFKPPCVILEFYYDQALGNVRVIYLFIMRKI